MAVMRVFIVLIECLVVADRLDVEEVELLSSEVFAFLAVEVAISVGGDRLDWNVDTESLPDLSFSKISTRFRNCCSVEGVASMTMSRSILVRLSIASSASVLTVFLTGSYFICLPLMMALDVKNDLIVSSPYSWANLGNNPLSTIDASVLFDG